MHGRDVDDGAAATVGEHPADGVLGAQERAAEVDAEHLVEGGRGQSVGVLGDLNAGVVDEEVDRTELVGHRLEHGLHLVLVRDVGFDEDGLATGGPHLVHAALDAAVDGLLGGFRPLDRAHVIDADVHTLLTQPDGDGLTDAGAASGDDCDLVLQALHRSSCQSFGVGCC